ncbi:MAG: DUF3786 domain-containing protein [Smithellaceae bacterium]|nr:DUF3786 domain-containing protein [Smithellaceae bacterium]
MVPAAADTDDAGDRNRPSGEGMAWDKLAALAPGDVCTRALVDFDERSGRYIVSSFGRRFGVDCRTRKVREETAPNRNPLPLADELFNLSVLWYLLRAQDIPLSGKLVKPANMAGGDIFWKGSHALPLKSLAERFGASPEEFISRAMLLAGRPESYGDAAARFYPLPRVPVLLLLWAGDVEFPARAEIMFDSTCVEQAPLDIIWSVAMMTILLMLKAGD